MTEAVAWSDARGETRARIEQAALDLFSTQGFDAVTIDGVADAAGISRRTFFRYFGSKADAVWGDVDGHVRRLEAVLAATPEDQPVLASICAAHVQLSQRPAEALPLLRQRLRLVLTEPALVAHARVRYGDLDRVVAAHVARRTGSTADALVPRLAAATSRAAVTTAFQTWLADGEATPTRALQEAFAELAAGFPSLRG